MLQTLLIGVVAGFAVSMLANFCTTIFLHRALAHRALTARPELRFVFRVLIWIATGIRPRQWAAVHRKHHAYTDVDGDPHSPVLLGWRAVQMRNVALYRAEANDPATVAKYAKDIPADRWDRILFDRALVGLGLGIALLCAVLGWQAGLVASFVHVNVYLATSAAVNAMAHHFGRRPYDDCSATNLQWLAWLTAGEGLHNNHHAAPTSARLSHRRGEFDPGWWAIVLLRRIGLVQVRLNEIVFRSSRRPSKSAA